MKLNMFLSTAIVASVLLLGGCAPVALLVDGAQFTSMGNAAMAKESTGVYTANAARADVFNAALTGLSSVGEIKNSDRTAGVIQGEYAVHKVTITLSDLPGNKTKVSVAMKYNSYMKLDTTSAADQMAKLIDAINKQSSGVVLAKADN